MRHATILVSVLLAGSLSSLAQDRALITGDAEDKQDTPVPDVRIVLRNDSLRIERSTTTNSDGLYFFADVAPAEGYVISAEAPGMEISPRSVKFDVEVGETRHLLPSFITVKQAVPVSSLDDRRPPDSTYSVERFGSGVSRAIRAKRKVSAAARLSGSGPAFPVMLSGSSSRMARFVAYVPGRQSTRACRSVDNLAKCSTTRSREVNMKRAPGSSGRGILA